MDKPYDYENIPQWRFILIPDYSPTESRMVHLINHNLADGIAIESFYTSIQPNPDFSILPKVPILPLLLKILYSLYAPIGFFEF